MKTRNNRSPHVALIGLGKWGLNWFRSLSKIGCQIRVFDKKPGFVTIVPGLRKMPKKLCSESLGGIQGAILATPAETHFKLAKQILQARVHVLVEKPLALRSKEAEELNRIATKNKTVLMTGHLLDYHPGVLKLRKLIGDGIVGKIRYITSNRLNFGTIRQKENVLWSFAPHDISVILRILGTKPISVRCNGAAFNQKKIPDISLMQLHFANKVQAFIYVSWFHPFKEQRLVVVGSKGMLSFCDLTKELVYYPSKIFRKHGKTKMTLGCKIKIPFSNVPPLDVQAKAFLQAVRTGQAGPADGQAGLDVLKILEAGEKSMRNNGEEIRCNKSIT